MGLMGNLFQGLAGNLSEISVDELYKEYNDYLMDGERIHLGFKLIRDVVIFTDRRILDFDKQGATGQKMRVNSIFMDTIINVTAETAGFGFDDSEMTITYIVSPYFKASGGVALAERKYEFPKRYNIQPLYKVLAETAWENHQRINE